MSRPLVSILTPTWERSELLAGAIENVRAQTYRPVEHVIVSDGQGDRATYELVMAALSSVSDVPIRYVALGRNWSSFLVDSFCAAPTTAAMLLAQGEYQAWLADDERMDPEHIELLVALLEARGADFAYSRVRMWMKGTEGSSWVIGTDPPRCGQITNVVYRAEVLRHGLFAFGAGGIGDWATINRWINAGATWAYLDRVTLTHRADR